MRVQALLVLAPLLACRSAHAGNQTTLPSVTVTGVTVTSPVLRSTPGIVVSADAAPTFDTASGPITAETSCVPCNTGNSYCGTGDGAVKSQQVLTATTVTIANQMMMVKAAPEFGARNPTISVMNSAGRTTGTGGAYTGVLPTQTIAEDGIHTVTVTAYVSEDVTTTITATTNWMTGGGCGGEVLRSVTGPPVSSTVAKYGTGSGTGSYVLDINPPTLSVKPATWQRSVQQGGNQVLHAVLSGGSASTPYTLAASASGAGPAVVSGRGGDQFGPSKSGVAAEKHEMVSVHVPCDCPVGEYSVDPASTTANTVDLALNPFPPITPVDAATFLVEPGQFLIAQTVVAAELPPIGDYGQMTCFRSTPGGPQGSQVSTFPGSIVVAATVNTAGPCAGFAHITDPSISLTLPIGFRFAGGGAPPPVEVFLGPAQAGFDLRHPKALADVTPLIPKAVVSPDGQTVTAELSSLNLGGGPGAIPAGHTIYIRAHALADLSAVPADGTQFYFNSRVTAGLPGVAKRATVWQDQAVTATPACMNGN